MNNTNTIRMLTEEELNIVSGGLFNSGGGTTTQSGSFSGSITTGTNNGIVVNGSPDGSVPGTVNNGVNGVG